MAGEEDKLLEPYGKAPIDERGFLWPWMRQGDKLSPAVPGIVHEPYEALKRLLSQYSPGTGDEQPVRDAANVAGAVMLPSLGLNAMGMMPKNAVGIFGGRLAATADKAALAKAEEMAAAGGDRQAIWDATGWFQGRDGKWRFEIDDSASHWNPEIKAAGLDVGSAIDGYKHGFGREPLQRDLFVHPELYAAYPGAERIGLKGAKDLGVRGSYDQAGNIELNTLLTNDDALRSVNLHEIQHAIGQPEGFASGSGLNPALTPTERSAAIDDYMRVFRPAEEARGAPWRETWEGANRWLDSPEGRRLMYERSAGEVESRNVQKRADMTPEARRATPPWQTQDVPDADQILRQYAPGRQEARRFELDYFGKPVTMLENPTEKALQAFLGRTKYKAARRITDDATGDVYVWDAADPALHEMVAKTLGIAKHKSDTIGLD